MKTDEMSLEAKAQAIMATIATINAKRAAMDELLAKLERIAGLYALGIDPANIVSYVANNGGMATVSMRDGSNRQVRIELLGTPP